MKVILLQDVLGAGKKWEVKEVKGGYGRNYLLNRGLAVLATEQTLKDIKAKKEQEVQKKFIQNELLYKSFDSIKDTTLVLEKKTNEKGHLFDGVDIKEIQELIKEKTRMEIPLECIQLEKIIKEIGKHKIMLHKGDRKVSVEIEIIPKME